MAARGARANPMVSSGSRETDEDFRLCLSLNFRAMAGLTRRCHSLPYEHLSVRYMATDKYRPDGHMDSDLFSGWRNSCGDVD